MTTTTSCWLTTSVKFSLVRTMVSSLGGAHVGELSLFKKETMPGCGFKVVKKSMMMSYD